MISSKHAKQIIRSNADFAKRKRAERAYNALRATRINHKAPHAHHSGNYTNRNGTPYRGRERA